MNMPNIWPAEFATIVACKACTSAFSPKLLRDNEHNVPQPGYIGRNYWKHRVLLVGQNPGATGRFTAEDQQYTLALRQLRDAPDDANYQKVQSLLNAFIPKWPVQTYFPLFECGLALEDIAYFNAVRCRTIGNAIPDSRISQNCVQRHLTRWLDLLEPKVIVFIGKWAADQATNEVSQRKIPTAYMNRQRSLSKSERLRNRDAVIALVRASGGENCAHNTSDVRLELLRSKGNELKLARLPGKLNLSITHPPEKAPKSLRDLMDLIDTTNVNVEPTFKELHHFSKRPPYTTKPGSFEGFVAYCDGRSLGIQNEQTIQRLYLYVNLRQTQTDSEAIAKAWKEYPLAQHK